MKQKMLKIIIVIVTILALIMAGWYVMFSRLGIGPAFPFLPENEIQLDMAEMGNIAENQLMALVETEDEAEVIAEQYGIELVSFADGVAAFRTEEDPHEVIARGEENGFTQLYLNYVRTID